MTHQGHRLASTLRGSERLSWLGPLFMLTQLLHCVVMFEDDVCNLQFPDHLSD